VKDTATLSLFAGSPPRQQVAALDQTTTFIDNMKLPVHRWFRFSAGFSAEWAKGVVKRAELDASALILDPFAGSGTTLLAAESAGVPCIGTEAHPFVARVAAAKLGWSSPVSAFRGLCSHVLSVAEGRPRTIEHDYGPLIWACYPTDVLSELDALRCAYEQEADGSIASELAWLALTSVLRVCSPVGTSQMELIQPKKRKLNFVEPFRAFRMKLR